MGKGNSAAPAARDTLERALKGIEDPELRRALVEKFEKEGAVPQTSTVHKWSKKGETVGGILYMKKEQTSTFDPSGKTTYVVYGFRALDENEQPVQTVILSTTVLKRELKHVELGTWVDVVYTGEKEGKKGQNPTKLFVVMTNPQKTKEFGERLAYDDDAEVEFKPEDYEG